MATAPVATAASANPVLSTLVAAVKAAGLVDTLNSASNITVFAPDNAAFAKIPAATLKAVLANKAELTKILTYHVASGRYTPAELASGMAIKTLEGGTVTAGADERQLHRQRRERGVRQRPDRQRHRLHHRHRADAEVLMTVARPGASRGSGRAVLVGGTTVRSGKKIFYYAERTVGSALS